MPVNSSSVPRLMLRNSGMSPIPSGSRRQTSSVMPGRMVGLTIPTTPRQLENDICCSLSRCRSRLRGLRADIPFRHVTRQGGTIALIWFAIAAPAGALQQKALARAHLDARGGRSLALLRRAEPQHEPGALAIAATGKPARRKARLVEAADDGCVLQQLILAPHREAT